MESIQLFFHYFKPHVMTRNHNVARNDDGGVMEDLEGNLSIFTHPGRLWGEGKKRSLSLEEIKAAQTYILLNCVEVEPFVRYHFLIIINISIYFEFVFNLFCCNEVCTYNGCKKNSPIYLRIK